MGLLGAISGGAEAFQKVADRRLDQYNREDILKMAEQADMEKEKRIEEANIRAEGRGIINKDIERKAEIASKTNPENVAAIANADVAGKRISDEYENSQFGIKLKQAGLLAAATRAPREPDNTDYEYRALQRQKLQQEIKSAEEENKLTPQQKNRAKAAMQTLQILDKAEIETDDEKKLLLIREKRKSIYDEMSGMTGQENKATGSAIDEITAKLTGKVGETPKQSKKTEPVKKPVVETKNLTPQEQATFDNLRRKQTRNQGLTKQEQDTLVALKRKQTANKIY